MPERLIAGFFAVLCIIFVFFPANTAGSMEIITGVISDPSGAKSLTGSYVIFDPEEGADCYEEGVSADFAFYAESYSADWEYVYYLWLSFPEGWVINSVTSFGEACDSGSWGNLSYAVMDPANAVLISHTRNHGSGGTTCYCWYTVNATPGPEAGDASVSWYWDGDNYGGAPHHPCSSDGYTPPGQEACDEMVNDPAVIPVCTLEPGIYITPEEQTIKGCPGIPADFTVNISNLTGAPGEISLSYSVTTGNGSVSGPASISLDDGEDADITVTITSDTGLVVGETVSAQISAGLDTYSDTAVINQEVVDRYWTDIASVTEVYCNVVVPYNGYIWDIAGYGDGSQPVRYYDPASDTWTEVADSGFGNCYARSGAVYGNKAFIYGDTVTAGFEGLWSYNMDTNTWTNESPSGAPPALTGIWVPAWVADPVTGYLYITGGAISEAGGFLSTVYVYDPAGNAWLDPLPNFSTARGLHAAFIYEDPSTLHKMLAVVGGVDDSRTDLNSTQCYDFETGVWNAENNDIAELPIPYWGFGYAHNILDGEHQLWLVAGASGWAAWHSSLYYDLSAVGWIEAGPPHEIPSLIPGSAALNGEVYKISGSYSGGTCSKYTYCHTSAAGDTCDNPIVVSIPAGLDYEDLGQTTCGRGDSYDGGETSYDNGEDIFYRLDITEDASVTIEMVPYDAWTSIYVFADCPENLDPDDYIEGVFNSSTDPRIIEIDLLASESPYYIMCDSWPEPECYDFDLYIYQTAAEGPDASILGGDISYLPADPMPGDTVEITARVYNIGDQDITSASVNFYYSLEPGIDLQLIGTESLAGLSPAVNEDMVINWATGPEMDPRMYIITVEIIDVVPEDSNPDNNTAFIEIPLPVDLSFFTAQGMGNTVSVQWITETETDNLGFNLYRLRGDKVSPFISFTPVRLNDAIIEGQGTSSEPRAYSFTDRVKNQGKYIYILECISTGGTATDEYRTRVQWLF